MDWKATLKTLAPMVATAIGGPFAPLAGAVVSSILGQDKEPAQALQDAIASGDPESYARIKKIEQDFIVQMETLGIKREELEVRDRESARDMQKSTGSVIVPILACVIVGGFLGMVAAVLFGGLKAESALAGALIGYVSAKAEQVVAFYFGSSLGSKQKTESMAKSIASAGPK